ncbi:MAG: molybdopterin converting factor subunit 1 [Devosia sp.]|nr:molybdopterin converting factor subunit 1 [Devosia sp.]
MKILYFAWLRERLNKGEEEVSPPPEVETVDDLMTWLAANDEATALAFERRRIIRAAVDAEIATPETAIASAKVVAFFPPMTGG